jgi:hypothetical protein
MPTTIVPRKSLNKRTTFYEWTAVATYVTAVLAVLLAGAVLQVAAENQISPDRPDVPAWLTSP